MTLSLKNTFSVTLISLLLINISAQARSIPDNKKKMIAEILQQTGTTNVIPLMTNQLVGEILSILKKKDVPLDQNLVSLVQNEAKTVMYEEFILSNKFNEIFYELYDEHFSTEQLVEIAAFYNSSAGKKVLSVMPDISKRSMEQARAHSQGIGTKVQQRIMKRFDEYEKQKQDSGNNKP